ncbi:hypothetical protein H4R19_003692 [Coemansia spiralis]|nr:hypothetical protein H4R19_003692 [Coemansia spiralis]
MVQHTSSEPPPPPPPEQPQQQPPRDAALAAPADAAAEKKDDKAAPVRKRLSLACTTCRQRKVKCDGGRPSCRTCAKFNWACIYQPSNRKRGPRPRALALMDGSPYGARPHWSPAHGYYAYGIPGHPGMSPPMHMPPPPVAQQWHHLMASMPDQRYMENPQNGAPIHAEPAHGGVGSYNHDLYSTYGDYIASTGGIRIRPPGIGPPPPPPPHPHPHMAMGPHHPSLAHGRQPMHSPPFAHPMSPPAMHVVGGGGPTRHRADSHSHGLSRGAGQAHPTLHHPYHPGAFSHPPGNTAAAAEPGIGSAVGGRYHAQRASPTRGVPSHMHVAPAGAAVSPAAPQRRAAMGKAPAHQPADAAWPGSAAAAPQPMHPPAQPYNSASAYAPGVQPASTDVSAHVPAIYADTELDMASSRDTSTTASSPAADARPALSSPVQPSRTAAHASLAKTAPIPSSASFHTRPAQYIRHQHAPRPTGDPAREPSQPLPFSDGASRPQLPPLSEVFGKDYQLLMSPSAPRGTDTFATEVARIRAQDATH